MGLPLLLRFDGIPAATFFYEEFEWANFVLFTSRHTVWISHCAIIFHLDLYTLWIKGTTKMQIPHRSLSSTLLFNSTTQQQWIPLQSYYMNYDQTAKDTRENPELWAEVFVSLVTKIIVSILWTNLSCFLCIQECLVFGFVRLALPSKFVILTAS